MLLQMSTRAQRLLANAERLRVAFIQKRRQQGTSDTPRNIATDTPTSNPPGVHAHTTLCVCPESSGTTRTAVHSALPQTHTRVAGRARLCPSCPHRCPWYRTNGEAEAQGSDRLATHRTLLLAGASPVFTCHRLWMGWFPCSSDKSLIKKHPAAGPAAASSRCLLPNRSIISRL